MGKLWQSNKIKLLPIVDSADLSMAGRAIIACCEI